MERKKLYNEASLNDLLQAAAEESQEVIVDETVFKTDIEAFILHHKLRVGTNPVKKKLLYQIYKNYSKSPVNPIHFNSQFSLYIPAQNDYYIINKDPSELISDLSLVIKKKRRPRIRESTTRKYFQSFLDKYQITKGEDWIELHIVLHFYDRWIYETQKKRALSNTDVEALMRVYFENRRTKDGYVFKINHALPQQSIDNLRESWKRKKRKPKENE